MREYEEGYPVDANDRYYQGDYPDPERRNSSNFGFAGVKRNAVPGGNKVREDATDYLNERLKVMPYESTEVLFDQRVEFGEEGTSAIGVPLGLEAGGQYKVTFKGEVFDCIADIEEEDGTPVGISIETPYNPDYWLKIIEVYPEIAEAIGLPANVIITASLHNVSVPVKIEKSVIHTIDPKFLPGGGGGAQPDWNAAEGEPGHILNRTHNLEKADGDAVANTALVAGEEGIFVYTGDPAGLIVGEKYTVTYNGTNYTCTGYDSAVLGEAGGVALGNIEAITGAGDTGEPFVAMFLSEPNRSDPMHTTLGVIFDLTGSTAVTIRVNGPHYKRNKIGREWLPNSSVQVIKLKSVVADLGTSLEVLNAPDFGQTKLWLLSGNDLIVYLEVPSGFVYRMVCTQIDSDVIYFECKEASGETLEVLQFGLSSDNATPALTQRKYKLTTTA